MAIGDFTIGEMVIIGELFSDSESELVRAILKCPELLGLLPYIVDVTNELLTKQKNVFSKKLKEFIEQGTFLDKLHDKLVKGVHNYLDAAVLITVNEELINKLIAIRKLLFTNGLSIIKKSYRTEAGAAKLRMSRITDSDREFLRSIPTLEGNLAEVVDRLNEAAVKLGKVEDMKVDETLKKEAPTAREILTIKHKWVRILKTFISITNVMEEVPAPIEKVLERIKVVDNKAHQQKKAKGSEDSKS